MICLGTVFVLVALVLVVCLRRAEAYLDAGSGSIILQAVIAGFLGALFVLKVFWKKIRAFFGRLFSKRTKDETSDR